MNVNIAYSVIEIYDDAPYREPFGTYVGKPDLKVGETITLRCGADSYGVVIEKVTDESELHVRAVKPALLIGSAGKHWPDCDSHREGGSCDMRPQCGTKIGSGSVELRQYVMLMFTPREGGGIKVWLSAQNRIPHGFGNTYEEATKDLADELRGLAALIEASKSKVT